MAEDNNLDEDPYGELWIWENQCFDEVDNQPNYESQLQQERDVMNQKLWHLFQNSATCIAQLHKGSSGGMVERNARWVPFQTAAGSVTALYKESMDSIRRCTELGVLHGQQRRTRDLAAFLRRRRHVRRDELLSLISGKPLPAAAARNTHHRASPRPHPAERGAPARLGAASILVTAAAPPAGQTADGLQPFRDALALSSLQGAMSAVSFRPPSPGSGGGRRRSPARRHGTGSPGPADFTSVKRPSTPASPSDVVMDSPTHKRPRLT